MAQSALLSRGFSKLAKGRGELGRGMQSCYYSRNEITVSAGPWQLNPSPFADY